MGLAMKSSRGPHGLRRRQLEKKQEPKKRINIKRLIDDEDTQNEFAAKLDERIEDLEKWEEISEACQKTAEEVLGFEEKEDQGKVENELITALSEKQKQLRMKMITEKIQTSYSK